MEEKVNGVSEYGVTSVREKMEETAIEEGSGDLGQQLARHTTTWV